MRFCMAALFLILYAASFSDAPGSPWRALRPCCWAAAARCCCAPAQAWARRLPAPSCCWRFP
ncbi:MAG: hypothetical protein ACLT98_12275 [Eggerthellaceae bacterium]